MYAISGYGEALDDSPKFSSLRIIRINNSHKDSISKKNTTEHVLTLKWQLPVQFFISFVSVFFVGWYSFCSVWCFWLNIISDIGHENIKDMGMLCCNVTIILSVWSLDRFWCQAVA